jgi:ligand-binding sensor domain-containing protein
MSNLQRRTKREKGSEMKMVLCAFILSFSIFQVDSVWSAGTWQHITEADGVTIGYVCTIACGPDGSVWCGGDNGVCRYYNGRWEHMLDGFVLALTIDREGSVWVSSSGNELLRFSDNTWTSYINPNYMFVGMTSTPDGGIWGANVYGVSRFLNGEWTIFTTKDGLPSNAMYIVAATTEGKVWCAFDFSLHDVDKPSREASVKIDNGVSCYDGGTWMTYTTINGLPSDEILDIAAGRNDSVFVSTATGITLFDGSHWETVYPRFGGRIALDSRGTLWASWSSNEGDLSSYRNGLWVNHGRPSDLNDWPRTIDVDLNGTVWIGGYGVFHGVFRYDPSPLNVSEHSQRPVIFDIAGSYPNPFNPSTSIEISASDDCIVTLSIYSLTGQCIRRFSPQSIPAGSRTFDWDGKDGRGKPAASGCYIACFRTGYGMKSHLMTLLR